MKIFFDTEFIEDGKTIDLISIGLVREGGRELYLESSEFDTSKASQWVKDNVISKLTIHPDNRSTRKEMAEKIREFVGPNPEFWAYYADYDWVALCQLYGTMMDLPDGWPMYCRDLKQEADRLNFKMIEPPADQAHNALIDSWFTMLTYDVRIQSLNLELGAK